MSEGNEDDHDRQLRNLEQADDIVKHRIERADPIFSHAINTLWAGNGTASLAVLGAISATSKAGVIDKRTLIPLFLFMSGLICMCIGSLITLLRESTAINRMQRVSNMLDFQVQDVQSPIEQSGLTVRNWGTLMALFAGVFFIAGCLAGFLILLLA